MLDHADPVDPFWWNDLDHTDPILDPTRPLCVKKSSCTDAIG